MNERIETDADLARILRGARVIAMVGASPKPERASFAAMRYLMDRGYRVVPVNPGHAGETIHGQPVVARLADLDEPADMVDVFRRSAALSGIVDEVLAMEPRPRVLWTQLGVRDETAAERARSVGIEVVMDRCPKIEHARLIA
ncbi:CoA-binding protein [Pararhizobium mangrovi]|uniref:CoA-binding protein n=1 Tax=Pararhizobium mangrovi TaxID=2590452 RepID=A0A506TY31_9HYPH|nr:CoA-binding protein [Pararhizobium mangrovi]TPW25871.1 CoA-binding protein [Pararhizobium mangrovi]